MQAVLKKPRELTSEHDVQAVIRLFRAKGTLSAALDQLGERLAEIRQSPVFDASPRLRDFVARFLSQILLPIQHLREIRWQA